MCNFIEYSTGDVVREVVRANAGVAVSAQAFRAAIDAGVVAKAGLRQARANATVAKAIFETLRPADVAVGCPTAEFDAWFDAEEAADVASGYLEARRAVTAAEDLVIAWAEGAMRTLRPRRFELVAAAFDAARRVTGRAKLLALCEAFSL